MSHVEADLARVVAGDVERLQALKCYPLRDLSLAARSGGDALTLTSATLAGVVEGLSAGRFKESAVQFWAALLRWGLLPDDDRGAAEVIDIAFEAERQDQIVEVLARLDEMGDVVDGVLSDLELEEMLAVLRRHVDRLSGTPGSQTTIVGMSGRGDDSAG